MKNFTWLNKDSRDFLSKDYLLPGQKAEDRYREIADNAEKILGIAGFADKFYDYVGRGFYSIATPVMINFGNDRGLDVSCFGSYIEDTLDSILYKAAEVGVMTKYGGGTSAYFGDLRGRGEPIKNGTRGVSSGPVHFMELFDTTSNVVSQSSARRGACAAYLPVEHPDILEFLQIRDEGHPIQNLNIGVTITDKWMQSMIDGDKKKRKIWGKVIQKRFESGFPYIFFTDTVNNNAPQPYKDKGVKIKASNLCCVVGSEMVVTSKGIFSAEELYLSGESLELFDGEKKVKSSPMKMISKSSDVYKITLENGLTHTITGCHKLPIFNESKTIVECKDLKLGDKVCIQLNKGLFGQINDLAGALYLGVAQSKHLDDKSNTVPDWIWQSNEETQNAYLRGLFPSKGFCIKSSNIKFIQELQILILNLGFLLPIKSFEDGFSLSLDQKNDIEFSEIVSIEHVGQEPVYCVNVDSEDKLWVCNGIITHNSEIALQSDKDNSFVCVLSSLNLLHWDEIIQTDAIETLIYFLDAVNEEFVQKSENINFMSAPHHFAKTQRALGAGVLGWHSFLQSKMIPFESIEAKAYNKSIFRTIQERSEKATKELAVLFGEPELLKGTGRRNITLLATAPTTSSSFILGQVSQGIEPENSNYYVKKLAKGNYSYKNPFLKKLLQEKEQDTSEVWESILVRGGSVQHLDFLSDEEKGVFKTFGEISQMEIVIQAAQRQKFIDQSQSLNLMVPLHVKPKEVSDLLITGWKMGIKTFYYQRGANPTQELSRSILTCASCEG